ncbi:ShlB/FhaC/HecB family hemolysin secretion/activation protein [Bradyrhizobium sp.]|uniref:ShlB/FhaC/HecB family hemolysin secretion/activation protein n=1 Tax=Bradyrhizobium sp. TaxID=376 RepID=UPI0025C5F4C9|nr:ShlB/FhaC/HecB family hemolysin secretion/activation protein [Bradyrhizobium sp.]
MFAWLLLPFVPVQAQQAGQPRFDPQQTERRFDHPSDGEAQPGKPAVRVPALARQPATADSKPLFVLRGIVLAGNEALPHERLAAAYQAHLGKPVSQADLAAIAADIGDLYRAAGFHLSRAIVPPQDIQGGKVRIDIVEGRIVEIALTGEGAEQFGVRPFLDPVLAERPARLSTLERQLLLINGLPGVRITDSALEEIGEATGRFRLIVHLKTWHVYAWLGVDNLGSSSVGAWQSYATAAFNSYLRPGDSLALNLSTIANDPRELGFSRLSYETPVGIDGLRVGGSALYSEVRPGDGRRLLDDSTATESLELHGSIAPVQSQQSTLTLTAAAGWSDVRERDVFGTMSDDHIRTASLTSDYRLQDAFGGDNYATMTYRQGLDIFGATRAGDPLASRSGTSPDFWVFDFWYTRYQTLSDAWSMKMSLASQTASGPLYTSQQFYLGGAAFGRGYGAAEISGDNAIAGSFEVRFDQKPGWRYLNGYQLYGFFDAGTAWNDSYRPADGLSLTSVGAGVRLFLWDNLQADLGVAFPLSYRAPDNETRSARLLFSVSNALKLCPERGQGHCL